MDEIYLTEAVSKSLELWTIISSYDLALVLLLFGVILHFARGFYAESLSNYKIRVSKENWSILFFIIRDFSLFGAFGVSLLLINPDMFADVKLPVPFFPLGTILLGIALIFKLKGRTRNNPLHSRLLDVFLILAAVVQYFGFVFVMEAAPEEWVVGGYASDTWLMFRDMRSNLNPELAMKSFLFSFPVLMIILVIMVFVGTSKKTTEIYEEAIKHERKKM